MDFVPVKEVEENVLYDLSLLNSELLEMKEIMKYTSEIVNNQREGVIHIQANMEGVHQEVVVSEEELKQAEVEKKKGRIVGKIIVGSSLIFLGVGGAAVLLCTGSGGIAIGAAALGVLAGAGTHYFI